MSAWPPRSEELRECDRPRRICGGEGNDQNAEAHADQAHVEAHVAIQDMAELVRDHALQFVAREGFKRSAGYGDGRVTGAVTAAKALIPPSLSVIHLGAGTPRQWRFLPQH